jgi:hypothetical protein
MWRSIGIALVLTAVSGIFGGLGPVEAAQRGTTCTLNGEAKFKPGLVAESRPTKYTFKGDLTDCLSTDGDLTSGKVTSRGTGTVGCATGDSTGKAKIVWNTGKTTMVKFTTFDVGAVAHLEGTVAGGSAPALQKGDDVLGELAFTADPTQCSADPGITSAVFQGQVGTGSPN